MESIEVPAEEGDEIFISYQQIQWSDCHRQDAWRKSVRFGYHCTRMRPIGRAEDDPWRIDVENILDRIDSIIFTVFRANEGEEQSA